LPAAKEAMLQRERLCARKAYVAEEVLPLGCRDKASIPIAVGPAPARFPEFFAAPHVRRSEETMTRVIERRHAAAPSDTVLELRRPFSA
jgi:hypothetical protein